MPRKKNQPDSPVKRSIALHPIVDQFVRETWSILVKDPSIVDSTFSQALNFMLLAAVLEASKPKGWIRNTRESVWDFARDRTVAEQLKTGEAVEALRRSLEHSEWNA